MTADSRFLLVELHGDLASQGTTHNVTMLCLQHVPGVVSVVDLRSITPRTLVSFLMSDEEFAAALGADKSSYTSPYNLIRQYWKRVRQPQLPGMR